MNTNKVQVLEDYSVQNISQYLDILAKIDKMIEQAEYSSKDTTALKETHKIVWDRLNAELWKAKKGKTLVIDIALLPKDITIDMFLEYFEKDGIAFIDTRNEE